MTSAARMNGEASTPILQWLIQIGKTAVLEVAVVAGRPDRGGGDCERIDVDDQRGAHERGGEHADIAVAHPWLIPRLPPHRAGTVCGWPKTIWRRTCA